MYSAFKIDSLTRYWHVLLDVTLLSTLSLPACTDTGHLITVHGEGVHGNYGDDRFRRSGLSHSMILDRGLSSFELPRTMPWLILFYGRLKSQPD